jgi:hemolysin activation/secretion protein/AraC-like DNA-binding protein
MSVERHLILQELILRPSGEWAPGAQGWTIARVAEGSGYWMQGGNARALNAGDGLVLASNDGGRLRASQLGPLKLEWFTVQPQFLNGLLTVAEWHQLEITPNHSAPHVLHFTANEPIGQKFAHIANQTRSDGLTMRCAMLQLWASAVTGLLAAPASDTAHANKLRERFRQHIGQMLEAELSGKTLGELAGQLHCSGRHFSRLFRKEFGVPLRARQIELRLQRARQLLGDSDAKIINVAYDSGYRHLGLFNAMFKRRFGVTPSEWRQQNARKNPPATPPARKSLSRLGGRIGVLLVALGFFFGLPVLAQTNLESNNAGASPRAALMQKMAELDAQDQMAKRMARIHVVPVSTNAGPRFRVDRYGITGNTILSSGEIGGIFTNVPAAFGTNVTIDAILAAAGDLQAAYRERGYMTVVVGLPPQKLTNAEVNVKVTEAPLVAINVKNEGGRYFSSNNVMRALPDLRTNILLNAKIFQRELDAANMSRDRQIYPVVGPGPEPGTSELTLTVKDRLPWHARLEVNNDQATPGTPQSRVNFSSQYDNLWDLEHQIGVQYSFSVEKMKEGSDYVVTPLDDPLVANYSAYYRLPLGGYPSVQNQVDTHPGSFGYSEATHQFNLPPPTGRPELTFYASRAVSDTGVQRGPRNFLVDTTTNVPGLGEIHTLSITTNSAGENITLNEDLGLKLVMPVPQFGRVSVSLSLGADFKRFQQTSYNTNENDVVVQYPDQQGNLITSSTPSPQPLATTYATLNYLPLNAGLNGSVPDKLGTTFFNANVNFNVLPGFSSDADFAKVSYAGPSTHANYVTLQLGADRVQTLHKDWSVKLHADGQWANTPLIGNEQYSMGGTTGVRGYSNGEAYGDEGWRVMIEPQLPPIDIGMFGNEGDEEACWLRGSVFMDYGETYLFDPSPGSSGRQKFWGVGWGATVNLGSHLDGRVSMAWPLMSTAQTHSGDLHVYFGVGGQF